MKYINPLIHFIKSYILYFIALVALVSLSIAYTGCDKESIWYDIFKTLGYTMISGGVFAVILKSEQFSSMFQDELRKIVYGDEDLKNRNDLETLWVKVTKALCNQKFKLISEKLYNGVKSFYLPIKHDYYYKNYNLDITIEIDPDNPEYVIVKETTKSTLITDDVKPITVKLKNKIPLPPNDNGYTTYELIDFKINKQKLADNRTNITRDAEFLNVIYEFPVSEKLQYEIVRVDKKRYHLKTNNFRQHRAVWIYENFFIDFTYPKEINVKFIECGVTNEWTLDWREPTKDSRRLKAEYSGLIFQKQGFILLLSKD